MAASNVSSATSIETHQKHVGFGLPAIVCSLIILLVFISNKSLLKKSSFMVGLCVGDLFQGLSVLMQGVIVFLYSTTTEVDKTFCMIRATPWILLGNQISGLMFFLLGLERIIAVRYFAWYHQKWTNKLSWSMTLGTYLIALTSVITAVAIAFTATASYMVNIECRLPEVVPVYYPSFHYGIIFLGGATATVGTLVAMIGFACNKNRTRSLTTPATLMANFQSQWQICKTMLGISVCDLTLVVIPNLIAWLPGYVQINVDVDQMLAWTLNIGCVRASVNLFLYLFINAEFREAAYSLLHLRRNRVTVHDPKLRCKAKF